MIKLELVQEIQEKKEMNSINVNYKYYLKRLSAYKKFDEVILPQVDCLNLNQLNYIKRKLKEDGIIQETHHGGQWNDDFLGFEASRFKVDWNQWEVVCELLMD